MSSKTNRRSWSLVARIVQSRRSGMRIECAEGGWEDSLLAVQLLRFMYSNRPWWMKNHRLESTHRLTAIRAGLQSLTCSRFWIYCANVWIDNLLYSCRCRCSEYWSDLLGKDSLESTLATEKKMMTKKRSFLSLPIIVQQYGDDHPVDTRISIDRSIVEDVFLLTLRWLVSWTLSRSLCFCPFSCLILVIFKARRRSIPFVLSLHVLTWLLILFQSLSVSMANNS